MSNDTSNYDSFLRVTPLLVGGLVIACFVILLGTIVLPKNVQQDTPTPTLPKVPVASVFDSINIEARSAYVYDAQTDSALFEKNAYEALPLASITKLLSVVVAQSVFPSGTIITISPEALSEVGDSDLFVGERWLLRDLLRYTLTVSSNDGASAVAHTYDERGATTFVTKLNEYSQSLGLSSFSFTNATGLDEKGTWKAANFGSARDVTFLFAHALTTIPDILDATRIGQGSISSLDRIHRVSNTNTMIDSIPNAIGSKTGFTDAAGGNLVLSFDVGIGHPVIIVVLGSSKDGRFTDMQKLVGATNAHYALRD
ncbi:MAG: hypothetical protein NUW02_01965 [Candidatus Campbellbacteria bacterium]|nr:hypothetical protein [Candidatus Campbellbacteria bacterium]